jgi:hypothetical protein
VPLILSFSKKTNFFLQSTYKKVSKVSKVDYSIGRVLASSNIKKLAPENSTYADVRIEFKENQRDPTLVKSKLAFSVDQNMLAEFNSGKFAVCIKSLF